MAMNNIKQALHLLLHYGSTKWSVNPNGCVGVVALNWLTALCDKELLTI